MDRYTDQLTDHQTTTKHHLFIKGEWTDVAASSHENATGGFRWEPPRQRGELDFSPAEKSERKNRALALGRRFIQTLASLAQHLVWT